MELVRTQAFGQNNKIYTRVHPDGWATVQGTHFTRLFILQGKSSRSITMTPELPTASQNNVQGMACQN